MTNFALPDIDDLEEVIADYFDALVPQGKHTAGRVLVIGACLEPFAQLVTAWETVLARSPIEREIWRTFMLDLCRMSCTRQGEAQTGVEELPGGQPQHAYHH